MCERTQPVKSCPRPCLPRVAAAAASNSSMSRQMQLQRDDCIVSAYNQCSKGSCIGRKRWHLRGLCVWR